MMSDCCPSICSVFETFRACGLCGLVHPLYGVPLVVGPCMDARGAEARSLESEISLKDIN
jgi:hypothetical protein